MKVFIIDDEQIAVFIIRQNLISEGLSEGKDIRTFLSAKKALHTIKECSDEDLPEIILLDLHMPEMDNKLNIILYR